MQLCRVWVTRWDSDWTRLFIYLFNYFYLRIYFDVSLSNTGICLHALLWLSSILTRQLRKSVVIQRCFLCDGIRDKRPKRVSASHRPPLRAPMISEWRPQVGRAALRPSPPPPPLAPPHQLSPQTPLVVQHRGQLPVSALNLPPAGRMFQLKAAHQ